jgi:polyribonucleotide nucleotidyltransferase
VYLNNPTLTRAEFYEYLAGGFGLTDRPIRPLISKGWHNETQLVATVLSADQENDPDLLAVIGGSAVLAMSEVPFYGPLGAVRIGYVDNQMVVNPTLKQLEESQLDLVVASTKEAIVMLEADGGTIILAASSINDIFTKAVNLGGW